MKRDDLIFDIIEKEHGLRPFCRFSEIPIYSDAYTA